MDESEKRNWGLQNADVVDLILKTTANPELNQYVTALKVKFQRQPRDYQEILQEISSQVPSLHVPNFRKASEIGTQDHRQTKGCPDKGAYNNNGNMYIGKYPSQKWIGEPVKPHWDEIRRARSQGKDKDSSHKRY